MLRLRLAESTSFVKKRFKLSDGKEKYNGIHTHKSVVVSE